MENKGDETINRASEAVKKFYDAFGHEYEVIQTKFDAYFNKEGIVRPYDVDDFLYWLCSQYPDEPTRLLVDKAKDRYIYNLYHQYEVNLFKNGSQNAVIISDKPMQFANDPIEDHMQELDEALVHLGPHEESEFTAKQWASIFHYAVGLDLPDGSNEVRAQIKVFREKHDIQFIDNTLYNKYYDVKKQIDKTFTYKISDLEKIIPFMKRNYPYTIGTIENDIEILKDEQDK